MRCVTDGNAWTAKQHNWKSEAKRRSLVEPRLTKLRPKEHWLTIKECSKPINHGAWVRIQRQWVRIPDCQVDCQGFNVHVGWFLFRFCFFILSSCCFVVAIFFDIVHDVEAIRVIVKIFQNSCLFHVL